MLAGSLMDPTKQRLSDNLAMLAGSLADPTKQRLQQTWGRLLQCPAWCSLSLACHTWHRVKFRRSEWILQSARDNIELYALVYSTTRSSPWSCFSLLARRLVAAGTPDIFLTRMQTKKHHQKVSVGICFFRIFNWSILRHFSASAGSHWIVRVQIGGIASELDLFDRRYFSIFVAHIYLYVLIYAYMHAYISAYMHTYMHICTHLCINASVYAYMRACMHKFDHICIYAQIYAYMHR